VNPEEEKKKEKGEKKAARLQVGSGS